MKKLTDGLLGKKIRNTRMIPLVMKIIGIFTIFILASNFSTNYINLVFNRTELLNLMKTIMIKDLKDIFNFSNNQYEIYDFNGDLEGSLESIEKRALSEFKNKRSLAIGVKEDSSIFFLATKADVDKEFNDEKCIALFKENSAKDVSEGFVDFKFNGENYFGVYKYNHKWDVYIVRAEEFNEFYEDSRRIFRNISIIILLITAVTSICGIFLISFILRFVSIITNSIMNMLQNQKMGIIDLKGATNDDITFLGVAFNSLSSTINNLMNIFLKFVNKDTANKAYVEKSIKLEGTKKDLTILFSDIKSFTFMTETLGIDIIKLLNVHYESAIHYILLHDGIIGSIIGDALLAVYGNFEESCAHKSMQAIQSAYDIQEVTADLRESMHAAREEIEKTRGKLTEQEEKVFKAVLIEVGVGIDGGDVFYGNIGSSMRMTNTVIGDNVNSASRLEGLTRVYKVPVICSEYVKDDVEMNEPNHSYYFLEIDKVQVKGKTIGKKVYWPIKLETLDEDFKERVKNFSEGLNYYYSGDWSAALTYFEKCNLPLADVFKDRTKNYKCPDNWNGIWTMTSK